MTPDAATAAARYQLLEQRRKPVLDRARLFAELTIPSLLPKQGLTQAMGMPETYQSFGARCVTSLASRMMTGLLPPGKTSFRFSVPPEMLIRGGSMTTPPDVEQMLTFGERLTQAEIERRDWRTPTFGELQHLIVAGNVLEYMLPDNRIRYFPLSHYVVLRDQEGELVELITREPLDPKMVDPALSTYMPPSDQNVEDSSRPALYTWFVKQPSGKWKSRQEINGKLVAGSAGQWDGDIPFNALQWNPMPGQDYGRSKIEEHYADLRSLEGLSKALLEGAGLASLHLMFMRPNTAGGLNLRKRIMDARNGDVIIGNPDDVELKQFVNSQGLQVVAQHYQEMKRELGGAFLLNSAMRRDAERVTAYEISQMVEEIETTLGGVFSSLSSEILGKRMKRLLTQMQKNRQLPEWPQGMVEPTLLVGLEALSREKEAQRATQAMQTTAGLPPEVGKYYVKWPNLLGKTFNGLDLPDCVNSQDEANALMQQDAQLQAQARAQQQMQSQPQETQ